MELPNKLRRSMYNLSAQQRIGPEHQQAVGGFCMQRALGYPRRVNRYSQRYGPQGLSCLHEMSQEKCLYKLLAQHNDHQSDQIVKYDDIICLGSQFDD